MVVQVSQLSLTAIARLVGMTTLGFSAVTISTWIAIATVWHSWQFE